MSEPSSALRRLLLRLPPSWRARLQRWARSTLRRRRLLLQSRTMHRLSPGPEIDVLVFPVIEWGFRFQRPQQLSLALAASGHRVLYLGTGLGEGERATVRQVAPGVGAVELPGPPGYDLYQGPLPPEHRALPLAALDCLRREIGIGDALCLVQFPTWRPLVEEARCAWGWRIVYDCLDEHSGFSTHRAAVGGEEEGLVAGADLVTVTSGRLLDRWRPTARRILRLPNATDFQHFHRPATPPADLRRVPRPIVGYYGAIAEWFDVEAVAAVAAARPEWQIVLVGATTGANLAPLRGLPNVHLLGERPYAALPGYLHAFDVALVPFRDTPLTRATDPVKFYEYLSTGIPVVASRLPELKPHESLFFPVRAAQEWVPQIEAALAERDEAKVAARLGLARRSTWGRRAAELREEVRRLYPRVAIVIVAYADTERVRFCLDSLWSRTQHPSFRVVVVDNSGSPTTRELLARIAAEEPRLEVLTSERNEGFPRATNRGVRHAGDCEYVVLLNDDTVVTRGWLGKLIRHLEEPGVDLVGPVTNWAGNEARIEVDYDDIAEMEAFADAYTRRHEGEVRDIPMLAMYCVVMRRALLDRVGFLDERFGIGMFEDDDFSRRVRAAGGRVVCAEDVFVHHWGRASFGALPQVDYDRLFEENRRSFEAKWNESWQPHVGRR